MVKLKVKPKPRIKLKKKPIAQSVHSSATPERRQLEKKRRIQVAIWAYAYEIGDEPFVDDARYDSVCAAIDLSVETDRPDLDAWYRCHFKPYTGQWIHKHPELHRIKWIHDGIVLHRNST